MGYKKLVIVFSVATVVFVAFNYFIWSNWTKVLLTQQYSGGDLARMGYHIGSKQYRHILNDLPLRHLEMKDFRGQQVGVLTIGDSFSNGGGEGRNSYYQDYIASINKCTVLNVMPYPSADRVMFFQPVTTLAVLFNSGYLDQIRPRYVLLQTAERYAILRFAVPFTFRQSDSVENLRKYYGDLNIDWENYLPRVSFINTGNFSFIYNNVLSRFSDNAFNNKVYRVQLDRSLFTAQDDSKLLFFNEELLNMAFATPGSIRLMNDNLNRLSDILAQKGIKLYFMPIVDKYNMYSEFVVNNRYPRSIFFEELRTLPHRYMFIDTKKILKDRLLRGEKDIFFADDTHWTWRASQAVFEKVLFTGCCDATELCQH